MRLEHASALWAVAQSIPEAALITPVPTSEREAREYVEQAVEQAQRGTALPYAVYNIARQELVGTTRLYAFERWDIAGRESALLDVLELGRTFLSKKAQRTAINSEMKYLLLRHAFEVFGALRVTIKTDANNTQSRAAILRLGAKFEGILRNHMPSATGGKRDTAMYSVIAEEWPELRRVLEMRLER
jgi:RimJ/RimL family protein N-acetyltransferase